MSENFLSRWSRRKRAVPEQVEAEDERVAREQAPAAMPVAEAQAAPVQPPPDLPPIESLTPQADFSPFMKPEVPLPLKNAALKKLFTDPHFNVMDGLDIYIDDYTKPDPIPEAMLRSLVQSKTLKLFETAEEEAKAEAVASAGDEPQAQPTADAPVAEVAEQLEPAAEMQPAPQETLASVSEVSPAPSTISATIPAPDAAAR